MSSETTTRIFLLAENRFLRESLAKALGRRAGISVVGVSCFSTRVLEEIGAGDCEVLLLDSVSVDLWEFIREARSVPGLKIVLIGMEDDDRLFLRAVRAGAVGYVLKDAAASEVAAAVRAAANGEALCPPRLCLTLFQQVAQQWMKEANLQLKMRYGLTRREQQLVPLIARGFRNKEIASELNLSEQTIKNEIHRMLRKFGTSNRLAAVDLCRLQGLVS